MCQKKRPNMPPLGFGALFVGGAYLQRLRAKEIETRRRENKTASTFLRLKHVLSSDVHVHITQLSYRPCTRRPAEPSRLLRPRPWSSRRRNRHPEEAPAWCPSRRRKRHFRSPPATCFRYKIDNSIINKFSLPRIYITETHNQAKQIRFGCDMNLTGSQLR